MSLRMATLFASLIVALSLGAPDAFARPGGGFSIGSRGGRTFSMPSATPTAPRSASPFDQSMAQKPYAGQGMGRTGGLFSGGFGRGLLGGLLGVGLASLLFGHGLFGGLIWLVLIFFAARFVLGLLRGRAAAYPAGSAPGSPGGAFRSPMGPLPGGPAAQPPRPLDIAKSDYDAFERRLGEVQAAYSDEDLAALGRLSTPEMAGYFRQEIAANASRGLVNRIGDVRLLQGDLAESWREPGADYATVAMRFSLTDAMVERATGKVVSGATGTPEQATELWTFRRPPGADAGAWIVSAIQQAR